MEGKRVVFALLLSFLAVDAFSRCIGEKQVASVRHFSLNIVIPSIISCLLSVYSKKTASFVLL